MTCTVTGNVLNDLSKRIKAEIGISYVNKTPEELQRRLVPVMEKLGFTDLEFGFRTLCIKEWTGEETRLIAGALTIGETYFFRDPQVWTLIGNELLPEMQMRIVGKRRKCAVWSAACSTGEEAYTMALTCFESGGAISRHFVECTATDLNEQSILKARQGLYSRYSLRSTSDEIKTRYFEPRENGQFQLTSAIRSFVTFNTGNLIKRDSMGIAENATFDLIFCRNALMYFDESGIRQALNNIAERLNPDGWLLISPCDVSYAPPELERVVKPGVILLRRSGETKISLGFVSPATINSSTFGESIATPNPVQELSPRESVQNEYSSAVSSVPLATFNGDLNSTEMQMPQSDLASVPLREQAKAAADNGHFREAASIYCRLLDEGHCDATIIVETVDCLVRMSDFGQALICINKGISKEPLNERLYYLKSNLLLEQGNREGAIKCLRQTLFLDGNYLMAHLSLANLLKESQPEQSAVHFRNANRELDALKDDDLVPDSGGICVRQLKKMIASLGE